MSNSVRCCLSGPIELGGKGPSACPVPGTPICSVSSKAQPCSCQRTVLQPVGASDAFSPPSTLGPLSSGVGDWYGLGDEPGDGFGAGLGGGPGEPPGSGEGPGPDGLSGAEPGVGGGPDGPTGAPMVMS